MQDLHNIASVLHFILYRGVEQLAARVAHNHQVTGSSPVPATKVIPDKDLG